MGSNANLQSGTASTMRTKYENQKPLEQFYYRRSEEGEHMIRYLLAVALLVAASCAPARAGESVMKADAAYGVRYAEEKVVTLPQDQEKPYLTLFGDRNDPKFRAMVKWFDGNDTLVGIKNQTHFTVIYSDMPMYRERYASTMPALPCVRLQAVDEDQPVAEFWGANVPMSADALARGLSTSATNAECFRRRHENHCQPRPEPQPDPAPQPITPPPPAPKPYDLTWVILAALGLAGLVAGAAKHFSDVYHGRKA